MKDILVTSSVLILALLVLRQLFRSAIPRRAQYALWGLVLLRLLVPVSLPALEHNVLTAAEPMGAQVSEQLEQQKVYILPTGQVDLPEESRRNPELRPGYEMAPTSTGVMVVDKGGDTATVYAGWMTGAELLRCVWYAGMALTGAFFLLSNLRFGRNLRKVRTPYSIENCNYPVYLVESGLPSPCLFGLFRPAIYLTPAAVASPEALGHVIAHETTHACHLDPLWSALRGVCLTVYWFDPLVWAAAIVSRRDCELACDEGALKRLGEDQRIPYGRTLLSLVPVRKGPASPLLTATTMTAGKRQLKDRITRIAENRQTVTAALFLALALTAALCAATFTGAKSPNPGGTRAETDNDAFQLETTIPLVDGEPWIAEEAAITDIPSAEVTWVLDSLGLTDGNVVGCGTLADGRTVYYYADSKAAETLHVFLTCPVRDYRESVWLSRFDNVLGESGFTVRYEADSTGTPYPGQGSTYNSLGYYFFDENGILRQLAFAPGTVTERPWDTSTLLAVTWGDVGSLLYYQQGGKLWRVELKGILSHAYPEWQWVDVGAYDSSVKLLGVNGYLAENAALVRRYVGFDGENLLVYKDCRPLTDHVLGAPNVSDAVLSTAKTVVEKLYREQPQDAQPEGYDDWRIQHLEHCYTYDPAEGTGFHGMKIAVYQLNYEFHTDTPLDQVFLAGGMYVTEDGWVMPSYPDCTYLLFREENGQLTYLYSVMSNDTFPGQTLFTQDMEMQMLEDGTLTVAGMTRKELSELFYLDPEVAIRRLSTSYDQEQDLGCRALARTILEREDPTLFARLNAIGLTGRQAQTLDLLRYDCGDLDYGTLPQDILDFYKNVSAAYRSGIHQAARYIHFYNDMHREMFLSNGDRPLDLTLEYGRKINDGLYALVVRAEYGDGLKNDTPHTYCFVGQVGGQWRWITNVDYVPEALRKDLDTERYDYFSPNILGSAADVETEQPTEEEPEPAAPQAPKAPTEADLHSAILNFRAAQSANRDYDFNAEAHHILDETSDGDTHTYYMMVGYYTYRLADGRWTSETGGNFPAAATFAREGGGWVLTNYAEPAGEPDIRATFSQKAADALLSGENDIWWDDLRNQCDDAAVRYFAQTTGQVPAKQFTEADVEFQDQPLSLEADSMSYEERLQWIGENREYTGTQNVIVSDFIAQDGAVVYAAYWVGTPHADANFLILRLPDGRQTYLPLPSSSYFGSAEPDAMAFDGDRFTYSVAFSEELLYNEGQSLLHLKGTYRYTVDMTAGTVSLDVEAAA